MMLRPMSVRLMIGTPFGLAAAALIPAEFATSVEVRRLSLCVAIFLIACAGLGLAQFVITAMYNARPRSVSTETRRAMAEFESMTGRDLAEQIDRIGDAPPPRRHGVE